MEQTIIGVLGTAVVALFLHILATRKYVEKKECNSCASGQEKQRDEAEKRIKERNNEMVEWMRLIEGKLDRLIERVKLSTDDGR